MSKKVILITGTSKGIGRYLSERYLELGHTVIGCSRSASDLEHENYSHYELSVSDEKKVINLFKDVRKKHGKIDVLINNAGIASMNHITLIPKKTLDNILNTNVIGTFLFLREASKLMIRQKYGRIINFATVATPIGLEGESIYAASKAAVESITRIASKELSSFNITVNAVGPTPVKTDLIKSVPKEKMDALLQMQAIKRFGEMDDISNVIDFFMSDNSDFITGQVIYLGGVS